MGYGLVSRNGVLCVGYFPGKLDSNRRSRNKQQFGRALTNELVPNQDVVMLR